MHIVIIIIAIIIITIIFIIIVITIVVVIIIIILYAFSTGYTTDHVHCSTDLVSGAQIYIELGCLPMRSLLAFHLPQGDQLTRSDEFGDSQHVDMVAIHVEGERQTEVAISGERRQQNPAAQRRIKFHKR